MNIYISKPNEEWLRKQDGTMSGIINAFLDAERESDEDIFIKQPRLRLPPVAKRPKVPSPNRGLVSLTGTGGLTTADKLDEPECPRHHVAKNLCIGQH